MDVCVVLCVYVYGDSLSFWTINFYPQSTKCLRNYLSVGVLQLSLLNALTLLHMLQVTFLLCTFKLMNSNYECMSTIKSKEIE